MVLIESEAIYCCSPLLTRENRQEHEMAEHVQVLPSEVHEVLARSVLTDGMKLVIDLHQSQGSRLVDARNGRRYLDMYTFFASAPLGLNPAGLADDPTFLAELAEVAANKPANPRSEERRVGKECRSRWSPY